MPVFLFNKPKDLGRKNTLERDTIIICVNKTYFSLHDFFYRKFLLFDVNDPEYVLYALHFIVLVSINKGSMSEK